MRVSWMSLIERGYDPRDLRWSGKQEIHRGVHGLRLCFIDYDNDGWMDLFVLSGTRLEGAPEGTTNRLYKNNRDGTLRM